MDFLKKSISNININDQNIKMVPQHVILITIDVKKNEEYSDLKESLNNRITKNPSTSEVITTLIQPINIKQCQQSIISSNKKVFHTYPSYAIIDTEKIENIYIYSDTENDYIF